MAVRYRISGWAIPKGAIVRAHGIRLEVQPVSKCGLEHIRKCSTRDRGEGVHMSAGNNSVYRPKGRYIAPVEQDDMRRFFFFVFLYDPRPNSTNRTPKFVRDTLRHTRPIFRTVWWCEISYSTIIPMAMYNSLYSHWTCSSVGRISSTLQSSSYGMFNTYWNVWVKFMRIQ
jgi:hypothetical protein